MSGNTFGRRLPPHFGKIDPYSPFDAQRYFTALRATGETIYLVFCDDGEIQIQTYFCFTKTKLQKRRSAELLSWQTNKDPKRHQQYSYVRDLVRAWGLRFAPRTEADGDGPRYFHYPLC
jgi:hypothetical protein